MPQPTSPDTHTHTHTPCARTQDAFRLLFDDHGTFFARLHAELSQDGAATVTPWRETELPDAPSGPSSGAAPSSAAAAAAGGGVSRTVRFMKAMDVPAVVARLLGGVTKLAVEDVQELHAPHVALATCVAASSSGTPHTPLQLAATDSCAPLPAVVSTPRVVPPIRGLEQLSTRLVTWIHLPPHDGDDGSCVVVTYAAVEAKGVIGLQRLLEGLMLAEAQASVTALHAFAKAYVEAHHPAAAAAFTDDGLELYHQHVTHRQQQHTSSALDDAVFFDALPGGPPSRPVSPTTQLDAGGEVDWLATALLRQLAELHALVVAQRASLVALEARCEAMHGDVALLVRSQRRQQRLRAGLLGGALLAAGGWTYYTRCVRTHGSA